MIFQDMQNAVLQRLRQTGANWGGAAGNTSTSLIPPYWLKLELNQAYNRFLGKIKDFPITTLEVSFQTVANTSRFSLNPIPTSNANVGAFVQVGRPMTGTIVSLQNAPTNGNKVAIVVCSAGSLGAVTVKDSNGVALTQQKVQADAASTNSIAIYDYTVTGSPTENFTVSTSVSLYALAYEMSSVGSGTFASANGTSTTLTMTDAGTTAGDLQIAGMIGVTAASTTAIALSNGSQVADVNTTTQQLAHSIAASTASSTAKATGTGSIAAFYADYPSASQVVYNPCALQVYEYKYTQAGGQIRYIPFASDTFYRAYTAGYNQVNSSFSAFPDILRQTFGQRVIDGFPGYATDGDTITLTICPDPVGTSHFYTSSQVSCAQGNIMTNDSDVPLIPDEWQPAIVEGAVMMIARALDKEQIYKEAKEQWDEFVQEAIDFGSTVAEGDAQQRVIDTWSASISPELSVM